MSKHLLSSVYQSQSFGDLIFTTKDVFLKEICDGRGPCPWAILRVLTCDHVEHDFFSVEILNIVELARGAK